MSCYTLYSVIYVLPESPKSNSIRLYGCVSHHRNCFVVLRTGIADWINNQINHVLLAWASPKKLLVIPSWSIFFSLSRSLSSSTSSSSSTRNSSKSNFKKISDNNDNHPLIYPPSSKRSSSSSNGQKKRKNNAPRPPACPPSLTSCDTCRVACKYCGNDGDTLTEGGESTCYSCSSIYSDTGGDSVYNGKNSNYTFPQGVYLLDEISLKHNILSFENNVH